MAAGVGIDRARATSRPSASPGRTTPRIRTIRALAAPRRRLVLAVLAGWAALPLVVALMASRSGWQPTGDVALIGLRARDAWTAHPPLVGQPTTGSSYAGIASHHPGPVEYWLLGPWVRALGPATGMLVGTAVVNGAALAATLWVAFRRGGPVLLGLVSLAVAGLVRSVGAFRLVDPFNSELATFPLLLAVLAAWSVAEGDRRLLPLLAAAATVAAQTHVAGAALVAALLATTGALAVRTAHRHGPQPDRDRGAVVVAAAVLAVGWLPVLVGELTGPSNVGALARTTAAPHPTLGWPFAVERTVASAGLPPLFVWTPPHLVFLGRASPLGLVAAAIVAGVAAGAVLVARDRGADRAGGLVGLALLAGSIAVASTWTAATAPPFSALRSDVTRSTWLVSLLVWLLGAWAGWHLLPPGHRRRLAPRVLPLAAVLSVLLAGGAVAGVRVADERDGPAMRPLHQLGDDVLARLAPGTYRLELQGGAAAFTVGPGLALRLEDSGRRIVVAPGPFGDAYGGRRARETEAGELDGTLRVVTGPLPRPGAGERILAEAGGTTVLLKP